MADNKLELVVQVDAHRANASIKGVNSSLSSMEAAAAKSARGAAQGIDGMTAAMVKGATAGNLLADAIQSALTWAKEFTVGSVRLDSRRSIRRYRSHPRQDPLDVRSQTVGGRSGSGGTGAFQTLSTLAGCVEDPTCRTC
jgi:hypothetical protein